MSLFAAITRFFRRDLPDPDLCIYGDDRITPYERAQVCSLLIDHGERAQRARFYNCRGVAHHELGEFAAARADFDRALQFDPDNATVLHNRATLADELGDYPAALADADRVIALEPDRARGYIDRAEACYGFGDYEAALEAIEAALRIDATSDYALFSKGQLLVEMGRYAEAIAPLDAAITIDPEYQQAIARRMAAYAMLGDQEAEARDAERLLALDPDHGRAHASLAITYAFRDPDRALGHVNAAIAAEPTDGAYYNLRGALLERRGELASARVDIDQAVELWPIEPAFRANRAMMRIVDCDIVGAQADIAEGFLISLDHPDLIAAMAHLMILRGEAARAFAVLDEMLAEGDRDGAAICISGLAYLALRDDVGAREAFDRVLAAASGGRAAFRYVRLRWIALRGRAIVRSRAGNAAGAEVDAAAARALRPDVDAIFARWGLIEGGDRAG
jgi:tetratricopeptide (TPR) repeat protein